MFKLLFSIQWKSMGTIAAPGPKRAAWYKYYLLFGFTKIWNNMRHVNDDRIFILIQTLILNKPKLQIIRLFNCFSFSNFYNFIPNISIFQMSNPDELKEKTSKHHCQIKTFWYVWKHVYNKQKYKWKGNCGFLLNNSDIFWMCYVLTSYVQDVNCQNCEINKLKILNCEKKVRIVGKKSHNYLSYF